MKNQHFIRRFGFALNGIKIAFKNENSFRTQIIVAIFVPIALLILDVNLIWWAITVIVIAMVLAAELFNTALEALADHLHPLQHEKIKQVKDCAAGAVLVISLTSVAIGLLMLIDKVGSNALHL
jgi:undecaprenol kinase